MSITPFILAYYENVKEVEQYMYMELYVNEKNLNFQLIGIICMAEICGQRTESDEHLTAMLALIHDF